MFSWKTALITLAIFALGGLAGSLITAQVIKTKIEHSERTAPPPGWVNPEFPVRMVKEMEVRLKLTPEQVAKVKDILRRAQQELLRVNGEWQKKLAELEPGSKEVIAARGEWRIRSRRIFARSDESVREVLTKEQLSKWEEFVIWRRAMNQQQNRPPGAPPLPLRPGERGHEQRPQGTDMLLKPGPK